MCCAHLRAFLAFSIKRGIDDYLDRGRQLNIAADVMALGFSHDF
jgi:hypothetical protein